MPEIPDTITLWQSRLTGLPQSTFEGSTLEEQLALLSKWHGVKVMGEQMTWLCIARLMTEHNLTVRELSGYVASREARSTVIGRLNFVAGIARLAGFVRRVILPLLERGGYRPFLTEETGRAIVKLCITPEMAQNAIDMGYLADMTYYQGLSPHTFARSLEMVRKGLKAHPEVGQRLLAALVEVREAAVEVVAEVEDLPERFRAMLEETDATPQVE